MERWVQPRTVAKHVVRIGTPRGYGVSANSRKKLASELGLMAADLGAGPRWIDDRQDAIRRHRSEVGAVLVATNAVFLGWLALTVFRLIEVRGRLGWSSGFPRQKVVADGGIKEGLGPASLLL